jgi:hypothetical protein
VAKNSRAKAFEVDKGVREIQIGGWFNPVVGKRGG